MSDESRSGESVRLDMWLDVACLFRTRSEAQKDRNGRVDINGQPAKAHRLSSCRATNS